MSWSTTGPTCTPSEIGLQRQEMHTPVHIHAIQLLPPVPSNRGGLTTKIYLASAELELHCPVHHDAGWRSHQPASPRQGGLHDKWMWPRPRMQGVGKQQPAFLQFGSFKWLVAKRTVLSRWAPTGFRAGLFRSLLA
jgi:hypothetical protein